MNPRGEIKPDYGWKGGTLGSVLHSATNSLCMTPSEPFSCWSPISATAKMTRWSFEVSTNSSIILYSTSNLPLLECENSPLKKRPPSFLRSHQEKPFKPFVPPKIRKKKRSRVVPATYSKPQSIGTKRTQRHTTGQNQTSRFPDLHLN